MRNRLLLILVLNLTAATASVAAAAPHRIEGTNAAGIYQVLRRHVPAAEHCDETGCTISVDAAGCAGASYLNPAGPGYSRIEDRCYVRDASGTTPWDDVGAVNGSPDSFLALTDRGLDSANTRGHLRFAWQYEARALRCEQPVGAPARCEFDDSDVHGCIVGHCDGSEYVSGTWDDNFGQCLELSRYAPDVCPGG